jgi:hypothetical protein
VEVLNVLIALMKRGSVFVISGWLIACGSATMSRTGTAQAPRPANCDFQVFTAAPASGYVEIGAVDVTPGMYGDKMHMDLGSFKSEIRHHVCKAGGDAAFAMANGHGVYIKATILKRMVPGSSSTPAPVQPTTGIGGCSYDTQCKGDRICVDGKCSSPQPPASMDNISL